MLIENIFRNNKQSSSVPGDTYHAFNQHLPVDDRDDEFDKVVGEGGYDLSIPLVGYAVGIPPMKNDPGDEYMHGDYELEDEFEVEFEDDEHSLEDMHIPVDD